MLLQNGSGKRFDLNQSGEVSDIAFDRTRAGKVLQSFNDGAELFLASPMQKNPVTERKELSSGL